MLKHHRGGRTIERSDSAAVTNSANITNIRIQINCRLMRLEQTTTQKRLEFVSNLPSFGEFASTGVRAFCNVVLYDHCHPHDDYMQNANNPRKRARASTRK